MVSRILKLTIKSIGLALYLLITRTGVFITALWTILFFVLASPQVAGLATRFMKLAVPGPFSIGRIQPTINPMNLELWDVNFSRPNHQRVIHVDHLRVKLSALPLIFFLTGLQKRLVLNFDRVVLDGFDLALPFDKDFHFLFLETFVKPKKHKNESGKKGPLLVFKHVIAHKGHVTMTVGSWAIKLHGVDFRSNFIVDIKHPRTLFTMDVYELTAQGGSSKIANCPLGPRACNQRIDGMRLKQFSMVAPNFTVTDFSMKVPRGMVSATGAMSFPRDVGIRYRGTASLRLDDPAYLRDLTRGILSGPLRVKAGGDGTRVNPVFFAQVESPALHILGLDGPQRFKGRITGVKPGKGAYHFILRHSHLVRGKASIAIHELVMDPFVKGLVAGADIRFKALHSHYMGILPHWLGLSGHYSGRVRVTQARHGWRRITLKAATRVDRPGLFAPGPMDIAVHARVDPGLSIMDVGRLHITRQAEDMVFRGKVGLGHGRIKGRIKMAWDVSGIAAMLKRRVKGILHSNDLDIKGLIYAPVLHGRVQSTDIVVPGSRRPYALKAECTVSVKGLECSRLRVLGNNSVFVGRGLALKDWRRLGIDSAKGVLETGLLVKGFSGRVGLDVQGMSLSFNAPLSTLRGRLSVHAGRVIGKGLAFTSVRAIMQADRHAFLVKAFDFGLGGGLFRFTGSFGRGFRTMQGRLYIKGCNLSDMSPCRGMCRGTLSGELNLSMRNGTYTPQGSLRVAGARWGSARMGDIRLLVSAGRKGFINITGSAMNGAVNLAPGSGLDVANNRLHSLVLRGNLKDVDIGAFAGGGWPDALKALISARMDLKYTFGSGHISGLIQVPAKGVHISFLPAAKELYSTAFSLKFQDGRFSSQGMAVNDGQATIHVDVGGMQDFRSLQADVKGLLGAYFLRYFSDAVMDADGYLDLDLHIRRSTSGFSMQGQATTQKCSLSVQGLADTIVLQPGGRVAFQGSGGRTYLQVDEDHSLNAVVGNGRVALWGTGSLQNGHIEQLQAHMDGLNLRIDSHGLWWMDVTPQIDLTVAGGHSMLSGIIRISDGAFTKDYSRFIDLGYQSRSRGLLDMLPWLASTRLNVRVKGKNFRVRSKFPLGKTDIVLRMDLNLRGTLKAPLVYNRVEVAPGSTVFYNLVTRRFNVARGVFQFNGPMDRPFVDLLARTKVEYHHKGQHTDVVQSRFIADLLENDTIRDSTVITVQLRVQGVYPNLSVSLNSNARDLDQVDLEYLLLTGMTRADIGSGSAALNVGVLTQGLSGVLAKVLMMPVIDMASIGIQPGGGITADLSLKLGHNLSLMTSVEQSSTFARYTAGFRFRLTGHLTLEGFVRSVEMSPDPSEVGRRYESKLRYRIPLK